MASTKVFASPRLISSEEVDQQNGAKDGFWAVIDGFVVDATAFLDAHPGGLKKLLSADSAAAGATGSRYGFSFSKGRNSHFGHTARRFQEGVKKYLNQKIDGPDLAPTEVYFPKPGRKIIILGKLKRS